MGQWGNGDPPDRKSRRALVRSSIAASPYCLIASLPHCPIASLIKRLEDV